MGNENDKSMTIIETKQKGCCDNFSLYISNGKTDQSDLTCSICFKIFLSPRIMKCKHTFCEECIEEWGKGSSMTCPMCRTESKRTRGSFGRAHKRLQNRITKLFFKCRNCSWTGSQCQFITQFSIQPYLNDQEVPCDKAQQEKDGQIAQMIEQKKQKKECIKQVQKQATEKALDQQDDVVEVKMTKKSKEYEIFFEPMYGINQFSPLNTSFLYQVLPEDEIQAPLNNFFGFGGNK